MKNSHSSQVQGPHIPDILIFLRLANGRTIVLLIIELKWTTFLRPIEDPTYRINDELHEAQAKRDAISATTREGIYQTIWYLHNARHKLRTRLAVAQVNEYFTRMATLEDGTIAVEMDDAVVTDEEIERAIVRARERSDELDPYLERRLASDIGELEGLPSPSKSHRPLDDAADLPSPLANLRPTGVPTAPVGLGPAPPDQNPSKRLLTTPQLDALDAFWHRPSNSLISLDSRYPPHPKNPMSRRTELNPSKWVVDVDAQHRLSTMCYAALYLAGTIDLDPRAVDDWAGGTAGTALDKALGVDAEGRASAVEVAMGSGQAVRVRAKKERYKEERNKAIKKDGSRQPIPEFPSSEGEGELLRLRGGFSLSADPHPDYSSSTSAEPSLEWFEYRDLLEPLSLLLVSRQEMDKIVARVVDPTRALDLGLREPTRVASAGSGSSAMVGTPPEVGGNGEATVKEDGAENGKGGWAL